LCAVLVLFFLFWFWSHPLLPLPEHMYLKGGVKEQRGQPLVRPYELNVE
jgi:hypothetical protein